MCQAIKELMEDSRLEGRAEGKEEGREEILQQMRKNKIIVIYKKVQKGKTLDVIADELEEEVEEIKPIYDMVYASGEKCDVEKICEKLRDKQGM